MKQIRISKTKFQNMFCVFEFGVYNLFRISNFEFRASDLKKYRVPVILITGNFDVFALP